MTLPENGGLKEGVALEKTLHNSLDRSIALGAAVSIIY